MDFFNEETPVAIELEEQQVDDPGVLTEENPCLVCSHKAYANFIDISYSTSCTSSTNTPVKKRLKDILGRSWGAKQENRTLCLACYDLVDRFDSLESQLNSIRENITDKYMETVVKSGNNRNSKPAVATPTKKRGRPPGPKSKKKKVKIEDSDDDDDDDGNDNVFTVEISCEGEGDFSQNNGENGQQQQQQQNKQSRSNYVNREQPEEDAPNPNVYDEHHQLLRRGERIRLGKGQASEHGGTVYLCGYCPQLWADIIALHSHVHTFHQPEVVDVTIPPELGLGTTMNCGVEIQNCQEPPENPRPWSCLFCDQAFRARTNMSAHFKDKHTPHKPFSCTDCSEAFRKGIDLNRHKLYFCPNRSVVLTPKRRYNKRKDSKTPQSKSKSKHDDSW